MRPWEWQRSLLFKKGTCEIVKVKEMADVRVKDQSDQYRTDVVSIWLGERNILTPVVTDVLFQSLVIYIYIYIILMNLYFIGNSEQGILIFIQLEKKKNKYC